MQASGVPSSSLNIERAPFMSSGFVSGGTIDEPNERDDEWRRTQQELEEERRRKAELGKQNDGKSLYEILQQNKMAKQEAFEESIRLKNQFRALDEDEVEFLDSLLESTRAQEAAVKKETAEQLAEYQRQREEAERALIEAGGQNSSGSATKPTGDEEQWVVAGRKRKRNRKDFLVPPKIRKSSFTADDASTVSDQKEKPATTIYKDVAKDSTPSASSKSAPKRIETVSDESPKGRATNTASSKDSTQHKVATGPSLGLVAYDSDEDSG
ncbi:conserved hypothetical protein [Talaromyces stipitatus ATCC 10500]|uniref:FAM192A/Fyv6 N-terminal domain-containing protein n=1 Tax=Talaromyces stipitatus (strain ATCC 10500 / CBS 375.48 / QM 6759 / NRRL 1006) TaxID=441959 RepID=B8LUV9_TALSN|nr:uncharacterized protein TSTA_074310 [Talaromyces stipitatus ATCC 10500]EED24051.1 conserved hypothetical protein [Talaromyces stipitatus ATCC 10500]